jgi:membrane fusion protein, multidrug efflux system
VGGEIEANPGSGGSMKVSRAEPVILLSIALALSACNAHREKPHDETRKITVGTVESKAVTLTQQYICQIHSRRHISVRALVDGYVAAIPIAKGQRVKQDDVLFQIKPLNEDNLFSIKAPFDGVIDRVEEQQGSLIKDGDALTTLSDNSEMWVYFTVPEKRYLEFMAEKNQNKQLPAAELMLANDSKFPRTGKIAAIAQFNKKTADVAFRADFPNPDGVLSHGQAGTVLINRELKDAIVVPQRATFEALGKRYVYVVDKDDVAHQREIAIQDEVDDLFVVEKGVRPGDKIVVDGLKMVRDGEKVKN